MIRLIDFQVVIEKRDTHDKYYPQVITFNTEDDLPFSKEPSASIVIASSTNLNDVKTASIIEYDDIIRLRAAERFNVLERQVWVDLFEGRVQNQSKNFGTDVNMTLTCVGHITEAKDKLLVANHSYTNIDATSILHGLVSTRLERIIYDTNYTESGITVSEYSIAAQQSYLFDVFQEMEKVSGYKWMIDVAPKYFSGGNLEKCCLVWKPLATTATKQYAAIEGTPRLISATFDVVGEDVKNYRYVRGGTDTDNNQYSSSASDADSISEYGERDRIDTYSWVKSTARCAQLASGLLTDSKLPYVAGEIVLEGTLDAHKGDLVTVKIPSLAIKNTEINGDYTVSSVKQNFTGSAFTTTLNVGRIKKTEYDYINQRLTQQLYTAYKNQILTN